MTYPAVSAGNAYQPLTVSTDPTDPVSVMQRVQLRLVQNQPDFSPNDLGPITALANVVSILTADLYAQLQVTGQAFAIATGRLAYNLEPGRGTAAMIVTTITAADTLGHVVPAGTQVAYAAGAAGQSWTFSLPSDVPIPPGQSQIMGVLFAADEVGSYMNAVPAGTLEVQDAYLWLVSVIATQQAAGGLDIETDAAYVSRVSALSPTLSVVPVLEVDYARLSVTYPGVTRVLAIRGYDPATQTSNVGNAVAIYPIDSAGNILPTSVQAGLASYLDGLRGTNTLIRVGTPVYVALTVMATVVPVAGQNPATVLAAVQSVANAWVDPSTWAKPATPPLTWTGDHVARPFDLGTVIEAVPGVAHADVTINGVRTAVDFSAGLSDTHAVLPAGTGSGSWSTSSTVTVQAGT